jgi:signal peptidase I
MRAGVTPAVDRSKVALVGEVLHRFGEARVQVSGSSMLPSIRPGDVLTIRRRLADEIRSGEVAVFTRHDRLFAHRVVGHLGRRLVTQGDRVPTRDAPVSEDELLGVVVSVSRGGRGGGVPADPAVPAGSVAALRRRSSLVSRILHRLGRSSLGGRRVLG